MKKLSLKNLQIKSFITTEASQIRGGEEAPTKPIVRRESVNGYTCPIKPKA